MDAWQRLLDGEREDIRLALREEFEPMEQQVIIFDQDTTLRGITVCNLWYKGFYTYGTIEVAGTLYSVKCFEGWQSWEVVR